MKKLVLLAVVFLGACGADGPPVTPALNAGVKLTPKGISTSASAGVRAGNVAVLVGL
ncbi:hypothetical protein [Actibacterium mucosum]|uniref:hypothetical protein n=1 Tax=Actibacterium mucosum TaxID=1087332 RepID=UPI00146FAADE|nr:hypothetical protein [Actibacterium mucosum]